MRFNRRILSITLACILVLMSMVVVSASAQSETGGTMGAMKWTYKPTEGALHINCAGDLPVSQPMPWVSYADMITTVVFYNQVTSIPAGFLDGLTNVTVVKLPGSLRSIGNGVLSSLPRLSYIMYEGREVSLQSLSMSDADLATVMMCVFQQATIEKVGNEQVYVPYTTTAVTDDTDSNKKSSDHDHHHHRRHHRRHFRKVIRRVIPASASVLRYVDADGKVVYASVIHRNTRKDTETGDITSTYVVLRNSGNDVLTTVEIVKDAKGKVKSETFVGRDGTTTKNKYTYFNNGKVETVVFSVNDAEVRKDTYNDRGFLVERVTKKDDGTIEKAAIDTEQEQFVPVDILNAEQVAENDEAAKLYEVEVEVQDEEGNDAEEAGDNNANTEGVNNEIPASNEAPAAEAAPASNEAPAAEAAPTSNEAPAAEAAPASNEAPAAETAPASNEAPAAETAPASNEAPAAEAAPASNEAPAAETAPASNEAPAAEAAPASNEAPTAEAAPAADVAPTYDEVPSSSESHSKSHSKSHSEDSGESYGEVYSESRSEDSGVSRRDSYSERSRNYSVGSPSWRNSESRGASTPSYGAGRFGNQSSQRRRRRFQYMEEYED